jgi:Protein of unknown function DUF2625
MKIKHTYLFIFFFLSIITAHAQSHLRSIEELTADTSGWSIIKSAMSIARNKFEILPSDSKKAGEAIYQTQVTTRSPMGAIIYLTGGILIDNGWIRILGSGSSKLTRSLPQWNKGKSFNNYGEAPKFLLVADDALGGLFAINGGAFGTDLGEIYYLAPDDGKWEAQHITYTEFINFCFVGNMDQYYDGLRWKNWKDEIGKISGDEGYFIYPYLWTKEGKDITKDTRKIVPMGELYISEQNALGLNSK